MTTPTPTPPNDVFCIAPFIHANFESDDTLRPCCAYWVDPGQGTPVHQYDQWWDQGLEPLRQDMLAGRPNSGCRRCYDHESRGLISMRQNILSQFPRHANIAKALPAPEFLMMGIGNHCDLKCMFCSPHKSSAWGQEYSRNEEKFRDIGLHFVNFPRGYWSQREATEEIMGRCARDARVVHFSGGEPLLIPDYLRVLDGIADPDQVELTVNTSLASLTPAWMAVFAKFKTQLNVSVESANAINDYIREGSDWQQVHANIQQVLDAPHNQATVNITHVFCRTSVWTLPSVVEYCNRYGLNLHMHDLAIPEFLQISAATMDQRESLWDLRLATWSWPTLPSIIDQARSAPYRADLDQQFWRYIDMLDQLRGRDFRKLINEYT